MKTMTVKKTSANTKALLLPLSYEELVKALRGRSKAAKESAIKRMLSEWCSLGGAVTEHLVFRHQPCNETRVILGGESNLAPVFCISAYSNGSILVEDSSQARLNTIKSKEDLKKLMLAFISMQFKRFSSKTGAETLNAEVKKALRELACLQWISCVAEDLSHCDAKHNSKNVIH